MYAKEMKESLPRDARNCLISSSVDWIDWERCVTVTQRAVKKNNIRKDIIYSTYAPKIHTPLLSLPYFQHLVSRWIVHHSFLGRIFWISAPSPRGCMFWFFIYQRECMRAWWWGTFEYDHHHIVVNVWLWGESIIMLLLL